ncbi:uncharacterized protein LOC127863740 isoform X2 [Dreissena polymorpha]|uniref:FAM234A/B beta-propeller domain-containing protein n=1 Tax=Dreissena polymorpha TaxID=45954 RepID=A0A9D3Y0Z8_DREPO|nr:uncharacterized protein LOC127863740 isoform X2 [Dreissena polymorpha]KAH3690973.1 hypothetical protein DPMN_192921 [Dreissena polymorpha]
MPRPKIFGKGGSRNFAQYKRITTNGSDEDEFSLSEEDVLYKRPVEIKLNLLADVKVKDNKLKTSSKICLLCAVVIVVACVLAVGMAFYKFHRIESFSKTNATQSVGSQQVTGWKKTFNKRVSEGANMMFDVNEDGKPDILSGAGDMVTYDEALFCATLGTADSESAGKFSHYHQLCADFNLAYPCMGVIFAVRGYDGEQLWELPSRSEPLFFNCEEVDVNKDNKTDCIVSGRYGTLMAFDPRKGKMLWMSEPDDFIKANWNVYRVVAIGDLDHDGVTELLVANGGDVSKTPDEHDRAPGRLLIISGADGKPYGRRYLNMPNRRETYMSPVLYKPFHQYYILFGSGGETVNGDLLGISLSDFLCYTFPNFLCKVSSGSQDDPWSIKKKDEDNIFIIYRGEKKGAMVTPVIVDANNDGVQDIIVSMFEGKVVLIDGKTTNVLWTTLYPDMESYSTPAPGYFNDDDILDYMVHWNTGIWMTYSSSNVSIINGKDGSILWTMSSAYMQFSSSLVVATNQKHKHAFVFRQQGRESLFHWTPEGHILRPGETPDDLKVHFPVKDTNSGHMLQRRHSDTEDVRPNDLDEEDLKRLNLTRVEYKHMLYKLTKLTCEDDVTSFRGEVLLIDRDSLNSAYQIIDMPIEKIHYKVMTRNVTHLEANNKPLYEDEVIGGKRSSGSQGDGSNAGLLNGTVKHDNSAKEEVIVRKCLAMTQFKGGVEEEMCSVESADGMTTGLVGDFDGDGFLDYMGIFSLINNKYNSGYEQAGVGMAIQMQKVSIELQILNKTLDRVQLNAVTDMQVAKGTQVTPSTSKPFLPPFAQPWTQFMGKSHDSIYPKNLSTIL